MVESIVYPVGFGVTASSVIDLLGDLQGTYSGLIGLRMLEVPCSFWESDLSIPRRYLRGVEPRPLENFLSIKPKT